MATTQSFQPDRPMAEGWLPPYFYLHPHPSKHVPIPSFQPVKKKREEETSVKTLRELLVTTTNAIANPSLATAYNYNNPRGGKYSRGEFLANTFLL